jgi:predicted nucleotidyltransferase
LLAGDPGYRIDVARSSEDVWEGVVEVEEAVFQRVLRETADILRRSGIPHLFMGGVASAALGRPRWTHDIDLFVGPDDARRSLALLAEHGFDTQETDPEWLFKALKDDVLVDVIFLSDGRVSLDEEMAARARWAEVQGIRLPVIGPEDLIVIKALVHKERSPRHWFDALALLRRDDLDWDYLLRRARRYNPLRVLSLLYFARSSDQVVPGEAIRRLREAA